MPGVIIFVLVVAIAALAVGMARRWTAGTDEAWAAAAEQLGLKFVPIKKRIFGSAEDTNRHLRGTVEGRSVRVYTFTEGSGDNQSTYTGYQVRFPPLGLGLKITQEGMWGKVRKVFGSQDIEVGDEEFDKAYMVKGDHPDKIAAFLTPSRRMTIDRLVSEYGGARIGDDHIFWRSSRVERDPDALVTNLRRLAAAANGLAGRPKVDAALATQLEGNLGEAARQVREAARETPDLETRRTAAEVLYADGDLDEAAAAFDELAEALPVDAQVRAWQERIAARRAAGAKPPDHSGAVNTDPAAVADELFDPDRLSYETARLFEDGYEGTAVRWSGTLVRATGYRSDLDFRDGPGTKAVFHVHTLSSSLYAGRNVEAVVELPAEAEDQLRGRRDEEFTFTGTLHRIDPLMRNLYVRGGRLV